MAPSAGHKWEVHIVSRPPRKKYLELSGLQFCGHYFLFQPDRTDFLRTQWLETQKATSPLVLHTKVRVKLTPCTDGEMASGPSQASHDADSDSPKELKRVREKARFFHTVCCSSAIQPKKA